MRTIAYLGPENTYTHMAAKTHFGHRCRYLRAPTVEDVFHIVEREEADYGVVPVENSLGGSVTHTLDRFIAFKHSPVSIHGEVEQLIKHMLITRKGVKPRDIRVVFSHPQALAQCHRWLAQHMPNVVRSETNSTAEAVDYLLSEQVGPVLPPWHVHERAVIGMKELAVQHQLKALAITQEQENKTRFLILALGSPMRGRRNKTSMFFALKDKPGALHDALVPFKQYGINLTKIESRPSRRKAWEYLFFVDLEGHASDHGVKRALNALRRRTALLRILGSYPVKRQL